MSAPEFANEGRRDPVGHVFLVVQDAAGRAIKTRKQPILRWEDLSSQLHLQSKLIAGDMAAEGIALLAEARSQEAARGNPWRG